jgi:hypothetical protein
MKIFLQIKFVEQKVIFDVICQEETPMSPYARAIPPEYPISRLTDTVDIRHERLTAKVAVQFLFSTILMHNKA